MEGEMFKLSAEDIVNQSFERRFRGYDPDQVEEFLTVIAREWEHMRAELERAQDEAAEKADELREYKNREQSLQDALEMTKRVSEEIKEKAEKEAELTVADAEVEADRILSRVEDEVAELRQDIHALKQQRNRYKAQLRSLLNSHMEMLDGMDGESFDEKIPRAPRPAAPDERDEVREEVEVGDDDIESSEPVSEEATEESEPPIRDTAH